MPRSDRSGDLDGLAMPVIFGMLFGVVVAAMTGRRWWVAIGVAVGAAIGAGRRDSWSRP